jgi:isoprene-epoxide---glutathione S-transferase
MITMYGFIPAWGLPDVSPFVSKTDLYMRMAKIPFRLVGWPQGDLTKTPVGKLPVIEDAIDGGFTTAAGFESIDWEPED